MPCARLSSPPLLHELCHPALAVRPEAAPLAFECLSVVCGSPHALSGEAYLPLLETCLQFIERSKQVRCGWRADVLNVCCRGSGQPCRCCRGRFIELCKQADCSSALLLMAAGWAACLPPLCACLPMCTACPTHHTGVTPLAPSNHPQPSTCLACSKTSRLRCATWTWWKRCSAGLSHRASGEAAAMTTAACRVR